MNKITIIAVPNGLFTFDEILDFPAFHAAISEINKQKNLSHKEKLKKLLTCYQMIDTLGQLKIQGLDDFDLERIADASSVAIDVGFEKIMGTFSKEEQAKLRAFFQRRQH